MGRDYNEIKNRYRDVMCSVSERQLLEDVRALIDHVELLRAIFAREAQIRAVEEAVRFFEDDRNEAHLPN